MAAEVAERVGVVVTAFVVFLLLFPFSGVDSDPPVHSSVFGNVVPSGSPWLAVAAGAGTFVLLELVRRRVRRRTAAERVRPAV